MRLVNAKAVLAPGETATAKNGMRIKVVSKTAEFALPIKNMADVDQKKED